MATTDPTTALPGGAALAGSAGDIDGGAGAVQARGYWENAFRRLRRDRLAIVSACVIVLFIIVPFIGLPLARAWIGHGPNDLVSGGVQNFVPVGPFSTVSDGHGGQTTSRSGHPTWSGATSSCGCSAGAQVSIEVGVLATLVGLGLGVVLGLLAGFYGGAADTMVSRLTEIVMAFPLLLFLIAISATVGERLNNITLGGLFIPGCLALTMVIGLFTWFYPARIIRAQVLSLREKEFIEAARMVGSSNFRIMRSHLLPHLVGTIIVYGTLTVAINILLETTLSFLGVGLPPPNASWGNMLDEATQLYTIQPWLIVWPGSRSSCSRSRSTCWATACATRSTRGRRSRALSNFRPCACVLSGSAQGATGGRVRARKRLGRTRMRRRPGLWLTLGALAAGVVLLGAAGCGSSDNGGAASGGNTSAIPPHQNGGVIKIALSWQHRLPRPGAGVLPEHLADRGRNLRQAHELRGRSRRRRPRYEAGGRLGASDHLVRRADLHVHGSAGKFKFNTGEPVTAATFQHALERDLNPKQASYFGAVFLAPFIKGASDYKGKPGEHVSGISVSGDKLTIQLTQKDGSMAQKLATPFACAIPNDTPIDPKGVHTIAGAGPYYISDFTPNRSIVLKKNPNYTGDRRGVRRRDRLHPAHHRPNQGTLETKNGQLDYINDAVVPAQNAQLNAQYGPEGTSGGPQRFFVTPAAVVSYLALNTARPAFKDELVRQAVNWAINRKAILQPSGYGAGVPADKYLPPQIAGSAEEQSIYPLDSSDLTKAKALMQQAGVSNITAVLYTCNQPPCPDRAAVIQQELKQIGINVQIKEFERGVQFTKGRPEGRALRHRR